MRARASLLILKKNHFPQQEIWLLHAVITNMEEKSRRNKAAEKKLWIDDEELLILRLRKQTAKLEYETPLLNKEAVGYRCEAARGAHKAEKAES